MAGRGHHTSHHGKHHVSHHHEQSAHMEHHHRARGGDIPGEHEGKMHDYTADSEVVKEAEGEADKKTRATGGAVKRARGGHTMHHGKHHVSHHHEEPAVVVHNHKKRGGASMKHVDGEGHAGRRRMDRPGRKRGGGIGADMTPLSSAARTREAGAHKADNDELES